MKTNFVLVDYENVQPKDLALLPRANVRLKIFRGPTLKKYPVELVEAVQPFGENAEYVATSKHGPNALDFHVAFYIGRLSHEHPGAFFHIISKDQGFDALLPHLKAQGIYCLRHESITDIPLVKYAIETPAQLAARFAQKLSAGATQPSTPARLRAAIKTAFSNCVDDGKADAIAAELERLGVVRDVEGKLKYPALDPECEPSA
jgi:hypothetical protein